ncbi:hypothetical protein [Ruminococcus sp.]|uniref:hypothetical protein n=1 Tax=Ruminococcus sp. TaxID=41978 RepID=UPI001B6C2260|nr:hypothetical protein [Ruminococcus sp.]MBP5433803.1 hypothetical protein [Ruminococcus sp.]
MKLFSRITAVIAAVLLCSSAWSCKSSEADKAISAEDSTAATEAVSASRSETVNEETTTATKTSAAVSSTDTATKTETSAAVTEAVTTATETTTSAAATTEPATEAPQKGFATCFEAAQAYYSAYLHDDANAVYDMFCQEEIEGYLAYLDTSNSELLDGKNAQVMFKRSKVMSAISNSIKKIHSLMAEKSDVPPDKWTTTLEEKLLSPTSENALKDFNKQLGTSFTNASGCGIVYYKDGNDEHDFIGNGCGFVELDGRWYLSYATVMKCELITYMDIYR